MTKSVASFCFSRKFDLKWFQALGPPPVAPTIFLQAGSGSVLRSFWPNCYAVSSQLNCTN